VTKAENTHILNKQLPSEESMGMIETLAYFKA
jgi:hypothetical protein